MGLGTYRDLCAEEAGLSLRDGALGSPRAARNGGGARGTAAESATRLA